MGTYDSVKVRVAAARGASMVGLRGVRVRDSTVWDGLSLTRTGTEAYATHGCPP
jgi:hypothetical protein